MTDKTEALPPLPEFEQWWREHFLEATPQDESFAEAKLCARVVWGAALAQRQQVPERRPDGMPVSDEERYLRRLLAARSGIFGAYFDDGEAYGQEHGIVIDFMRESVADIDAKLRALGVARALTTPQPPQEQESERVLHSFSSIDCEALIAACVPGGSVCDPQHVADSIRRYLNAWPAAQAEQEPVAQRPIVQISVNEAGEIEHARFYAPGLPSGVHDLWCASPQRAVEPLTPAQAGALWKVGMTPHEYATEVAKALGITKEQPKA